MKCLTSVALCLILMLVTVPSSRAQTSSASDVVVTGITWYDDNRNGMLDRGEEVAPGVTLYLMIGTYASHGAQPRMARELVSDSIGRFAFTFRPEADEPAQLWATWALRPGFPFSRQPMIVPPPPDYVGYNYAGSFVRIPLEGGNEVTVNLPLVPLQGVLERLPPDGAPDFPIPGGHFFTQTNGLVGGSAMGYAVTNQDDIPFWNTWLYFGGLDNIGYPISGRYEWDGYVIQAFQKAIFRWRPGEGFSMVRIYDELHNQHMDPWLEEHAATPLQLGDLFDAGKPEEQVIQDRLALLDADPAIKDRYLSVPQPRVLLGLPTSAVQEYPQVALLRTQCTVLQHWKVDVPWAKAGQVTLANGGDIMKEHAMLGLHLLPLESPPPGSQTLAWLMGWSWRLRMSLTGWVGRP